MIQWAATINSGYIAFYLPDPVSFAFLVHGFPLIGLSVSFFTQFRNAKIVWCRLTDPDYLYSKLNTKVILILTVCIILISAFYLYSVPFEQTGLFAIFTNSENAAIARENSLKTLSNALVKYSYSFMLFALAPLLAVLLAILFVQSLNKKRQFQSLAIAIVITGILFLVSLTGERSPSAFIILTIVFALFLNKGLLVTRSNIILALMATVAVLALPTLLTILREGKAISLPIFWRYLTNGILKRVFYSPMEAGLHYVHYAQTMHFFGVAGIQKIAILFGVEPIDTPNLIGLKYEYSGIKTVSANACYVLTYYSYFGLCSLFLSLIGLWLLDFAVWIYRRLSDSSLLACVASVSIVSIYFVSGDYTTVLLTNGFGIILIVVCSLDLLFFKGKKA